MKLAFILTTLASWSMGQKIIYPDEFDSMVAVTSGFQNYQPSISPVNNIVLGDSPSTGFGGFSSPAYPARSPERSNQPVSSTSESPINGVISNGVLKFALNMDDAVANTRSRYAPGSRENIIFSPLSVAATLALVLLGSATTTFREVSAVLGLNIPGLDISRDSESIHRMYGALISAVQGVPGVSSTDTSFANGIFVQDKYPIRGVFKAASQGFYNAEVINLDYERYGGEAQKIVNAWVNEKTRGKIPQILSSPPPPETSVILASALYFNGEWNQHFIEGSTRRKLFTVSPSETVNVDMMYNGGEFPFFEDRQLRTKILGLPYKGGEMTMYVLLPNDKGGEALRSLERRLNTEILERLIGSMRNQTCIIGFPRMKLSSTLSLRDALQSLGLNSLFDPATADLSLISEGQTVPTPTRFGGEDTKEQPTIQEVKNDRRNIFSYDDRVRGYHVEQWATGFSISRIQRRRRRRSSNAGKFRMGRSAQESKDGEEHVKNTVDEDTVEGKALGDESQRSRRQLPRQNNRDFSNTVDNAYQQNYQLDYIRNNIPLRNPGLFADDVLHRVEIDITEKGTEAAAATSVILTKDGNQKRLVADRPFLFFIRHEPTGLILFWGSVYKPTPNFAST